MMAIAVRARRLVGVPVFNLQQRDARKFALVAGDQNCVVGQRRGCDQQIEAPDRLATRFQCHPNLCRDLRCGSVERKNACSSWADAVGCAICTLMGAFRTVVSPAGTSAPPATA